MPSFVGRNLFDCSKSTAAAQVNAADGTLTIGGQPSNATALIYCPGATSMISNMAGNACNAGAAACVFTTRMARSLARCAPTAFSVGGSKMQHCERRVHASRHPDLRALRNGVPVGSAGVSRQLRAMIYATIAVGTATLPVTYQPCGLDSIADVNAKDAVVAANAAAALASSLTVKHEPRIALPSSVARSARANAFAHDAIEPWILMVRWVAARRRRNQHGLGLLSERHGVHHQCAHSRPGERVCIRDPRRAWEFSRGHIDHDARRRLRDWPRWRHAAAEEHGAAASRHADLRPLHVCGWRPGLQPDDHVLCGHGRRSTACPALPAGAAFSGSQPVNDQNGIAARLRAGLSTLA